MTDLAIHTDISTQELGAIFVKSGFFQDTKEQAQAVVKILAGQEMGFGPIASMQGVYIVKGRVSYAANLIAAAIQRSGKYGYEIVDLSNEKCTLHFYSRSDPRAQADGFTSTFTIQDAQQAGLLSENYKKFPRNMLFSRALTNGARWYCPEIFNGPVYTPDELGASVDDEGQVIDVGSHRVDTMSGEVVEEYVPTRERDVDDVDMIRSADDELWKKWEIVLARAHDLNVPVENIRLPISRSDLNAYGEQIRLGIVERKRQLAREDDARAQAQPAF